MNLTEQAKQFPAKPGVYLFKSKKHEVLYVGKAKHLKNRIRQYINGKDERNQIAFLLRRTSFLDYIITDTEKEALLLENTLIKKYLPRYNIDLRDDKSYLSIKISLTHNFPGIHLTRHVQKDGAAYFGPYTSGSAARETVEQITRYFKVRSCSDREFVNRVRPCLKYDIGRCTAPCVEFVKANAYAKQVEDALLFLKGSSKELKTLLTEKMKKASANQAYEEAVKFRDAIAKLKQTQEKQKMVKHGGGDFDVLGLARDKRLAIICVLMIRRGVVLDRQIYRLGETGGEDQEVLSTFLLQRYLKISDVPVQIVLPISIDVKQAMHELLTEKNGKQVKLTVASRGLKKELVQLAVKNAAELLPQAKEQAKTTNTLLLNLQKKIKLSTVPKFIECVDISNLSGREAVGSLVCYAEGKPEKSRYRLYNIRSLETPDDYAMIYEVLVRRFAGVETKPNKAQAPAPDLLLIDGGKGQLNIAVRALKEIGMEHLPVAAIAKTRDETVADRIFIPGRKNHLPFKRASKELLFLMQIRDETHRFGISAHRKRRSKQSLK